VAKTAQGLKGRILRKKFILPIKSWFFTFFSSLFFILSHGSHRYNLNVKFLIFFKKFYKVHNVEVLSQDPCQQKEF
jgi:hypothetical protein